MTRAAHCRFEVGDKITGTTYVDRADRYQEQPVEFAGHVVQIGSGWAGVDADRAFLWARLSSGREVKALIAECERM